MANVKVHPPGEAGPVAALTAASTHTVTDSRGRQIILRKPGLVAQLRLTESVGPEASVNPAYMRIVSYVLFLVSIDGEPVGFPQSKREIEGILTRLDDEGYQALTEGVEAHWGGADAEDKARDAVKNS